jgi:hypothetical protein
MFQRQSIDFIILKIVQEDSSASIEAKIHVAILSPRFVGKAVEIRENHRYTKMVDSA